MNGCLWSDTYSVLEKKYDIKLEFDLRPYDLNPKLFDETLKQFAGYTFLHNDRIIITHNDTQFYPFTSQVSLTLYNLYATLSYYNIPTEFVLMFTNYYGIERELQCLADHFNLMPIKAITSFYDVIGTTDVVNPIGLNEDKIEYTFCSLNGTQRTHRVLLLSLLLEKNLLNSGIISTHFTNNQTTTTISSNLDKDESNIRYYTLSTPSRINEYVKMDETTKNIWNKNASLFIEKKIKHPLITGDSNDDFTRWQPSFIQNALAYLVTETVGDYPYSFLTEKTFKGILTKRPMIIAGSRYSLATLRELGFKTWDKWWDESYDKMEYFYERANAISKIVLDLSCYSTDDQRKICLEMQDVLEYNFQHYVNNFCKKDFELYLKNLREG